jgi:hypothetical protein
MTGMHDEQKITQYFLSLIGQIKLLHWATTSYAKHKALDDLHGTLSDKVDLFVEAFIGRFKKQPLKHFTIEMKATSDTTKLEKYLESERDKIQGLLNAFEKQPELQNILEEIIAEFDKTLYLCNLS